MQHLMNAVLATLVMVALFAASDQRMEIRRLRVELSVTNNALEMVESILMDADATKIELIRTHFELRNAKGYTNMVKLTNKTLQ